MQRARDKRKTSFRGGKITQSIRVIEFLTKSHFPDIIHLNNALRQERKRARIVLGPFAL